MDAAAKSDQVRTAVLEIITYFSLFKVPVSLERLVAFVPLRANHLAVAAALRELITSKHIKRIGDEYGLKKISYLDRAKQLAQHHNLLDRAYDVGGLIGALPFVKAVVLVNDVAVGNVGPKATLDLMIVTTPGRIFIAQKVIQMLLRLDRVREGSPGRIQIDSYITVRGIAFDRDIMSSPDPHLRYWLLTALPVYGSKRWAEILQSSVWFQDKAPNIIWPRGAKTIDRWSWRWLDGIDDRRYRRVLKRNSQNSDTQSPGSFVRIRPDVVILRCNDSSAEITKRWKALLAKNDMTP